MKDLKPSETLFDSSDEDNEDGVCKVKPATAKKASARLGAERKKFQADQQTVSTCSTPKLSRPQTSYDAKRFFHRNQHRLSESDDHITHLPFEPKPMPLKSILKNRKHSFDDLDVTTRKGLTLYLQSKQREQHHANVHFT